MTASTSHEVSNAYDLASRVDADRIRADVEWLCREPRNSETNPSFHAEARGYITSRFEEIGCEVEEQSFSFESGTGQRDGVNVDGRLQASSNSPDPAPPAVLLGAHYDTVPGSPGADDNASGVAVMLECARLLASAKRVRPIRFVAFDAEERQPEVGLHGSTAYTARVKSEEATAISGAYILEMLGYAVGPGEQKVPPGLQLLFPRAFDMLAHRDFAGDSVVAISNWRSQGLARNLEQASRRLTDTVPILPVAVPRWFPIPHNLKRSDHAPFWDIGVPAIMVGDTANFRNPHYHQPGDTPETLDYDFLKRVARTVIAAVASDVMTPQRARKAKVKLR